MSILENSTLDFSCKPEVFLLDKCCLELPSPYDPCSTFNGESDVMKAIISLSRPTQVLHQISSKFCLCESFYKIGSDDSGKNSIEVQSSPKENSSSRSETLRKTKYTTKPVNVLKCDSQTPTKSCSDSFDCISNHSSNVLETSKKCPKINKNEQCELNFEFVETENQITYESSCTSPKQLILNLESKLRLIGKEVPKRDRLHNNFMKGLRDFIREDFLKFCTEFEQASNQQKLLNFESWLTRYIEHFFGRDIDSSFNESQFKGKWGGFQFIFGSLISKDTMKQMISSSREKAYFYGLLKCFKNSSQKKLAIMLKNTHLVYLLDNMFETGRIEEILKQQESNDD